MKERALREGFPESRGADRHRTNRTVVIQDEQLADLVWDRIRDHVPKEIRIEADTPTVGVEHDPSLAGTWVPVSLNAHWRVALYDVGGHFGPHRDAVRVESPHRRSFITVNGYLSSLPTGFGGATRFLRDEQQVYLDEKTGRYAPQPGSVLRRIEADCAGKAVIFFHDLMHDGEPIDPACPVPKWIYRSEVMYERDPSTMPHFTQQQLEARGHLQRAREQEANGEISAAIQNYRIAYRLDPSLEE